MAPTDRPAAGVTAASPGSAAAAATNPYELLVPQRALDNLKLYKYGAVDKSPLTKYIMKPYWDWAVTLFPMWMAYVHTCGGGGRARARAGPGARVGEWAGLGRTGAGRGKRESGRGRGAGGARQEISGEASRRMGREVGARETSSLTRACIPTTPAKCGALCL